EYTCDALVIATGATAKYLGIRSEEHYKGKGVSACATCDGFFFREQDIAVVGGGDSALEEAIFLTKFARSVTVIHRRDELRASQIMQDRAFANEKIRFLWNAEVVDVVGDQQVERIEVLDKITGETRSLPVSGLFVAIGHRPNTDLFDGQLQMKDNGYLITAAPTTRTSVPGVFACGDVQDDVYRQAITAAGSGCAAAIDAERWLEAMADAAPAATV
ncbi:MAG: NAD(P)/FAD-dependent oxidoreductase, partial [Acidimicrobiales bacterium]